MVHSWQDDYAERYNHIQRRLYECYIDVYLIDYFGRNQLANNQHESILLQHVVDVLKKDLCLGLWCICYDNGKDANSLSHLSSYLRLHEVASVFKMGEEMKKGEEAITEARKLYVAHWLTEHTSNEILVSTMKNVLQEATHALNQLCYKCISPCVEIANPNMLSMLEMKEKLIKLLSIQPQGSESSD